MTTPGAATKVGTLRVYLGAAPGVGKTFAMLNEGHRRRERGADVVVGYVETHRRQQTEAQVQGLEVIQRATIHYRDSTFEEMDTAAIIARRPSIVLVDELAHTNVPGAQRAKRWMDVEAILDAGIDVITTLNVQHLESVNDVVQKITGVDQRETVPDAFVRRANQIELVDMSPESLRRRMAHGNIYTPEKVDAALANYFRPGNLAALREIALLWVADRVEDGLTGYMDAHDIDHSWQTRERVAVAISGTAGGEQVIRRAARMAGRGGGELIGVYVSSDEGLRQRSESLAAEQRTLLEELGGTYHEVVSDDIPVALLGFARAERATQLVLGASSRSRWSELFSGSVIADVIRSSGEIDVHVISHAGAEQRVKRHLARRRSSNLSLRRQLFAGLLAAIVLPALTVILSGLRNHLGLSSDLLVYLGAVVAISALGGMIVGLSSAVVAFLLVNWFFTEPLHTFTITQRENLIALVIFLTVAATVSALVSATARRSHEAALARLEAQALARSAAVMVGERDPLPGVLDQLRSALDLDALRFERRNGTQWDVQASAGSPIEGRPESTAEIADGVRLVMSGRDLSADDRRMTAAFAGQLEAAMLTRQLQADAAEAERLEAANELRTALLRSVSHDLRTPLASIKASVSSLLASDVSWNEEDEHEFLTAIDTETDRLNRLVGNLLDMSRLQAGQLDVVLVPIDLDDVVAGALSSLSGVPNERIDVDIDESTPAALADPALLERALANLIANAVNATKSDSRLTVTAGAIPGGLVDLRIVDRGPGIPAALRDEVFAPFQRLDDRGGSSGIGLGLAIARGFIDAMGGSLNLDDTPGGGLTATVRLKAAPAEPIDTRCG